jgi:cob(I)alamin adenosyltransferase
MGNRLSKIVTKTGDDGTTGLGDGSRISKTSARIQVIGDIDELNSFIGLVIECVKGAEDKNLLRSIQNRLFDLGGELSIPGYKIVDENDVDQLEEIIETKNEHLPPLKNFILPGGNKTIANLHIVRAVARRAERSVIALEQSDIQYGVNEHCRKYLNRLSDLFFVMAREYSQGKEVLWKPKEKK